MSVLVTDAGFSTPEPRHIVPLTEVKAHQGAVDLAPTDRPEDLIPYLADLRLIRVSFPTFNDGRAFTVARRLRTLGYQGTLRAHGPVIADQYAMARRTGFDEVEIPDDLAARQPLAQWQARANWQAHDYLSRLKA